MPVFSGSAALPNPGLPPEQIWSFFETGFCFTWRTNLGKNGIRVLGIPSRANFPYFLDLGLGAWGIESGMQMYRIEVDGRKWAICRECGKW